MFCRHSLLACVVWVVTILPLSGCDNPAKREAHYIERGNILFDKGDLDKARVEYQNAARLAPAAAEPFYRLGLVDEQAGDLRNAFAAFAAAEQQDAHYYPAVLKAAQYYIGAEQYDQARKRVDAVLGAAPDNAEAHAVFAALLLRDQKLDEAELEARQALKKEPANISAYAALTGIYAARGQNDQAEIAVNEGIAHNPRYLPLLMLRVVLCEHRGDLSKTAQAYQAIFKLNPNAVQYRAALTALYVAAGRLDDAEATLRQGIAAAPDNWDIKHQLVLFLGEHRDIAAAEQEIQAMMRDNPENDEPYFWLADLYVKQDAIDKAVALLNQIVARGQWNQPALNARTALAHIDIARGDTGLAKQLVAEVLQKNSDNAAALYIRASLAVENGAYQSAIADLRTIIRAAPKDQAALALLGETLALQGHLDLAIDTLQKLVDINPSNLAIRVRLAQMVAQSGDSKRALTLIGFVTQTAPAYPLGWEAAARIAIDAREWLPAQAAIATLDKLDGQYLTASFLAGRVLEGNDRNEDALRHYAEVVSADPTTPLAEHALTALVALDRQTGHLDAAIAYGEALRTDTPFVLTLLGESYLALGKTDAAAAAFDKAVAQNPSFQTPYLDRARLYLSTGASDMALDCLQKGSAAAPGDFRAPMLAAEILSKTDHAPAAIALYDDLLTRNPALDSAANNLAALIADAQPHDQAALEKARQAAERFAGSNDPLLLDTIAWVYFRQDKFQLAQTMMERALAQNPRLPPQLHYHYGAILMKNGKIDQAKDQLRQAVGDGVAYPGVEDAKNLLASP
jgi:tetratricopeptide (TPR) repeat protein